MLAEYQIELTTRCNFRCWYCTGRQMEQKDMSWETFINVLNSIPAGSKINLQGEGEPTLWPYWWEGVAEVVRRGHIPTAVINGSRVDAQLFAKWFPEIYVSVDTVDEDKANNIGRLNLPKVLGNIVELQAAMPGRVRILTTAADSSFVGVSKWAASIGIPNTSVRSLLPNVDYVKVYPSGKARLIAPRPIAEPMACEFLDKGSSSFFNVDGLGLPCVYIKNPEGFVPEQARRELHFGQVPKHCVGCHYAKPSNRSVTK